MTFISGQLLREKLDVIIRARGVILDDPIPDGLSEPIDPSRPIPVKPPQKAKIRKLRVSLKNLTHLPRKLRTTADYQEEILDLFGHREDDLSFHKTRWVLGSYLRAWQMDVPKRHADPRAFFEKVKPTIHAKLVEEIKRSLRR